MKTNPSTQHLTIPYQLNSPTKNHQPIPAELDAPCESHEIPDDQKKELETQIAELKSTVKELNQIIQNYVRQYSKVNTTLETANANIATIIYLLEELLKHDENQNYEILFHIQGIVDKFKKEQNPNDLYI